jgi:hypothetical protein
METKNEFYQLTNDSLITDKFSLSKNSIESITFTRPWWAKLGMFFSIPTTLVSLYVFIRDYPVIKEAAIEVAKDQAQTSEALIIITIIIILYFMIIGIILYLSFSKKLSIRTQKRTYSILAFSKKKKEALKALKNSLELN